MPGVYFYEKVLQKIDESECVTEINQLFQGG